MNTSRNCFRNALSDYRKLVLRKYIKLLRDVSPLSLQSDDLYIQRIALRHLIMFIRSRPRASMLPFSIIIACMSRLVQSLEAGGSGQVGSQIPQSQFLPNLLNALSFSTFSLFLYHSALFWTRCLRLLI
jgi:hypothetical protein